MHTISAFTIENKLFYRLLEKKIFKRVTDTFAYTSISIFVLKYFTTLSASGAALARTWGLDFMDTSLNWPWLVATGRIGTFLCRFFIYFIGILNLIFAFNYIRFFLYTKLQYSPRCKYLTGQIVIRLYRLQNRAGGA